MSRQTDQLKRCETSIAEVLKSTTVGAQDRTRRVSFLDLALEQSEAWCATTAPRAQLGEVGGSSSPAEIDEASQRRHVAALAAQDAQRIPELVRELDRLGYELYTRVRRVTATIDPAQYPTEPVAGCRSCARVKRPDGQPTWGDVYDKAKKHGLCRWCYNHAIRNSDGSLVPPPLRAVEMRQRQGDRAADAWLAQQQARSTDCPSTFTHQARTVHCTLTVEHAGQHVGPEGQRWENRSAA